MTNKSRNRKMLLVVFSLATLVVLLFAAVQARADTLILNPTDDAMIVWNRVHVSPGPDYNITNFGNDSLGIQAYNLAFDWDYKFRSVLKFDLSSIPSGATLTSVTLNLTWNMLGANIPIVALHRMADDTTWNESAITWNNAPLAFTATTIADPLTTLQTSASTWTFDLSSWNIAVDIADGWVTFLLKDQNDQVFTPNRGVYFLGSEASSNGPELIIEYTSQVPLPPSALLLGSGLLGLLAFRGRRRRD